MVLFMIDKNRSLDMCCKIDVSSQKDAAHFLGKGDPKTLPKSVLEAMDTQPSKPATSLFDKLVSYFKAA